MTLPKTITIAIDGRPVFQIKECRLGKNRDSGEQIISAIDIDAKSIRVHRGLNDREKAVALIMALAEINKDDGYAGHLAPTLLESLYSAEWYNSGRPAAVATKPAKDATRTQMLDMGDDIQMIKRVGHQ